MDSRDAAMTPEVRNLRFELDGVPRHWHRDGRALSRFCDTLSVFFPVGERFFVASVNAHRDALTDDGLRERVRAFAGQEGVHAREHDRYNAWLARQGLPIPELEARVASELARTQKDHPVRAQLAATCALEHFTAIMARAILADPRVFEGAHPTMAALWRWHAAEEAEHKAIPFDVYRAVGGPYPERVIAMISATFQFWANVAAHQVVMMRADGILYSPREWARMLWFLFGRPGPLRHAARHYLAYFRPGFHPDDFDDAALIEAWRRAHPGIAEAA